MHEVIYALPPELAAVSTLSTSTQFGKNRPLTIRSVAKRPSANAAVAHIACPMVTPIFQKFMIDSIDWASTMCTVFISRAELIITNRVDHMHRSLSQARIIIMHAALAARACSALSRCCIRTRVCRIARGETAIIATQLQLAAAHDPRAHAAAASDSAAAPLPYVRTDGIGRNVPLVHGCGGRPWLCCRRPDGQLRRARARRSGASGGGRGGGRVGSRAVHLAGDWCLRVLQHRPVPRVLDRHLPLGPRRCQSRRHRRHRRATAISPPRFRPDTSPRRHAHAAHLSAW